MFNYHYSQTELQAIISIADSWSAGISKNETKEREKCSPHPLYSIFNVIKTKDNNGTNSNQLVFPFQTLNIGEKTCFPKNIKEQPADIDEYKKLQNQFFVEFKSLPTNSITGFIESLLFLLKKYTWCIPSNNRMDIANISLYEHLKTTAAFADCLYLYKMENSLENIKWDTENCKLIIEDSTCPVMLLGGDISGIQKFIYNIASRKAAVSLKGRSFYLQLLIDSVI
ncbi:CRISPR-associated protein Cas10/Csm1, partial [termite gut metagenome]